MIRINQHKALLLGIFLSLTMIVSAQNKHVNKKDFQVKLEQYLVTQAGITPKEAAKFFPVYREMKRKQRVLFEEKRRFRYIDTNNNKACAAAIATMDKNDIEIKKLQEEYHEKFIKILSASKAMKVIKAESRFNRLVMSKVNRGGGKKK